MLERRIRLPVLATAVGAGAAAGSLLAAITGIKETTTKIIVGAIGAMIAEGGAYLLTRRRLPDYQASSPDALASRSGTLGIPFDSFQALTIEERPRRCSRLHLVYADTTRRPQEFTALLLPEIEWIRSRMSAGVKPPGAYVEYAAYVRDAFGRALPPDIASRLGWTA